MLDPTTRQLIQGWLDASAHEPLFTFVEVLIDQRNRAEFQVAAYQHQLKLVVERTDNIIKPLLGDQPKSSIATSRVEGRGSRIEQGAKPPTIDPKPTKPTKSLGISLKL